MMEEGAEQNMSPLSEVLEAVAWVAGGGIALMSLITGRIMWRKYTKQHKKRRPS